MLLELYFNVEQQDECCQQAKQLLHQSIRGSAVSPEVELPTANVARHVAYFTAGKTLEVEVPNGAVNGLLLAVRR